MALNAELGNEIVGHAKAATFRQLSADIIGAARRLGAAFADEDFF